MKTQVKKFFPRLNTIRVYLSEGTYDNPTSPDYVTSLSKMDHLIVEGHKVDRDVKISLRALIRAVKEEVKTSGGKHPRWARKMKAGNLYYLPAGVYFFPKGA